MPVEFSCKHNSFYSQRYLYTKMYVLSLSKVNTLHQHLFSKPFFHLLYSAYVFTCSQFFCSTFFRVIVVVFPATTCYSVKWCETIGSTVSRPMLVCTNIKTTLFYSKNTLWSKTQLATSNRLCLVRWILSQSVGVDVLYLDVIAWNGLYLY